MLESLAVPAGYDRAGILAELDGIRWDPLPGMARVNIHGLKSALKDRGDIRQERAGMTDRVGLEIR